MRRSPSGYRLFQPEVFNRLAFIKRAQSLGLTLTDIAEVLGVHDQGALPCDVIKERLLGRLMEINQQISELITLKTELQGILSGWQEFPEQDDNQPAICPNLQP